MISREKHLQHYWDRVDKRGPDECWPWTGAKNWKGYGIFSWNQVNSSAQRATWMIHHSVVLTSDQHICHGCDNPECQNPAHLFLGNNNINIEDKMQKGRHRGARGERSGSVKINTLAVVFIRLTRELLTSKQLAKIFGISYKQVQAIWQGKTWKHILYLTE